MLPRPTRFLVATVLASGCGWRSTPCFDGLETDYRAGLGGETLQTPPVWTPIVPHRVDGVPAVTVAWRARGIPVPKMDYVRIYALSEEDRLFELGELFDVGPPPACNTSTGFWESFDNELLLPEFRPGRTVLVVDLVLDPEGGAYEDVLYVDLLEPD